MLVALFVWSSPPRLVHQVAGALTLTVLHYYYAIKLKKGTISVVGF